MRSNLPHALHPFAGLTFWSPGLLKLPVVHGCTPEVESRFRIRICCGGFAIDFRPRDTSRCLGLLCTLSYPKGGRGKGCSLPRAADRGTRADPLPPCGLLEPFLLRQAPKLVRCHCATRCGPPLSFSACPGGRGTAMNKRPARMRLSGGAEGGIPKNRRQLRKLFH